MRLREAIIGAVILFLIGVSLGDIAMDQCPASKEAPPIQESAQSKVTLQVKVEDPTPDPQPAPAPDSLAENWHQEEDMLQEQMRQQQQLQFQQEVQEQHQQMADQHQQFVEDMLMNP